MCQGAIHSWYSPHCYILSYSLFSSCFPGSLCIDPTSLSCFSPYQSPLLSSYVSQLSHPFKTHSKPPFHHTCFCCNWNLHSRSARSFCAASLHLTSTSPVSLRGFLFPSLPIQTDSLLWRLSSDSPYSVFPAEVMGVSFLAPATSNLSLPMFCPPLGIFSLHQPSSYSDFQLSLFVLSQPPKLLLGSSARI